MLHQVGVGALGPVFRTYEPSRDRLVAVKVFRLDITPEQARTLADELASTADARLFHPSVVEPLAAGIQGTVAYRADEYVAAESLDVALRHMAPAAIDKVLPIVSQLAGAIDFAREAGVGHGALHPRDVFLTPDEARATGFGVVDALERVGLRAPVRRPYSPPERIDREPWGLPADVFSLAVIAFELLTGRKPSGPGDQNGLVPSIGGPAGRVRAVFARAMHEEPARRFPTALAFADALSEAAGGVAAIPMVECESGPVYAPVAPAVEPAAQVSSGEDRVAVGRPVRKAPAERILSSEPAEEKKSAGVEPAAPERAEKESVPSTMAAEAPEPDDTLAEAEDEAYGALTREDRVRTEKAQPGLDGPEAFLDEESPVLSAGLPAQDAADLVLNREPLDQEAAVDAGERHEEASPTLPPPILAPVAADADRDLFETTPSLRFGRETPLHGSDFGSFVDHRPRPVMLPVAVTAILCLLLGFAAGYMVRGRSAVPLDDARSEAAPGQIVSGDHVPAATAGTPVPRGAGDEAGSSTPPQLPPDPPEVPREEPPAARETTAAATPPAARTGRLEVRSTPSRAAVTLNGKWSGRTPLVLDDLPLGTYTVRVVAEGYVVARERVTLSASTASRMLEVRLRQQATPERSVAAPAQARAARASTGSVYVDSRPRGARVFVDGKGVGTTPMQIPDVATGPHVVRFELPNHAIWTTSVTVTAGQEARVSGSLEPIR
ncbi:MAG TPA: PEGA domain-containing protein [Vicinamibacterales bacterium]|nr:PEGA domain-containing protein [Vicinamibacterales bacterium]